MLKAAAVFSDHMVLQRERPVAVFGEADGTVTATLDVVRAEAQSVGGRFRLEFPPMPAGGPFTLTLTCGEETAAFTDVMVGEVWLCGGQSNMEFRLHENIGGAAEAATAEDDGLRFYTVNQEAEVDEAMLARERETRWKTLAPGTCADVSAVAYYAGKRLREALGVPVGMLICCVGGTEISNWISHATLSSLPEGRAALAEFEKSIEGITEADYAKADADYQARVERWVEGAEALRREMPDIRNADISAKVGDFPWPPPSGPHMLRRPGNLFRTMTGRVAPYGARGLLWYQGESDSGKARAYEALFTALIGDWRRAFENDGLFVVTAQLPNYASDPAAEDWAAIRDIQRRVSERVNGCAVACLLDCGDSTDLHPFDKRQVGKRMANLALEHLHGLPLDAEAPRLVGAEAKDGELVLRFDKPLAALRGDLRSLKVNGETATARVADGALVIEAAAPAVVSYAWENDPAACLFAENGLPAFPFEINL